jgi:hypothetical protein
MAFVDTGDVVSGTIITEGWGDQVRANFLAGVPAIFSVKGDLAIATAPLTAARLAVGADDSTLLADSGTATGLAWQIQPAVRVYSNVAFDPMPDAWDSIDFTHERFDTDGLWTVVAASRITIPAGGDGLYLIGANIALDLDGEVDGRVMIGLRLLLNNATVIAQHRVIEMQNEGGTAAGEIAVSTAYALAATDYVEAQVYTNYDVDVLASGNYSPEFWAIWQRRA